MNMNLNLNKISLILLTLVIFSCEPTDEIEAKKSEITKAKEELFQLKAQIATLESELVGLGVVEVNTNLTLVSTTTIAQKPFYHRVDVRGSVKSKNNVLISAETPAAVKNVLVKEGQQVKKGQLLITQDGEVLKRSIQELESSLELATTMYDRQKKLWEQNIGTEVQYLEMKNRKESLELKLATTRSHLNKTRIKAPFNGVVDMIDVRVGEMAQPGMPIIRLVSMSNMYIMADVSESFIGKFSRGQKVTVYFPSTDHTLQSTISSIGQVINPNNRTFTIEISIPSNGSKVKPNMITVLTLADYVNKKAMVIPTNIIQSDRMGKYAFKVIEEEGNSVVRRVDIMPGITYGIETEIKQGLLGGENLVVKGGVGLAEGSIVEVKN
jgi:membrane fusion protein (multidrug efflux system)